MTYELTNPTDLVSVQNAIGLTGTKNAAAHGRILVAQVGDSRLANGKVISGSDISRVMVGPGSWLSVLSNGKISAPVSHNKAVAASTSTSFVGDGITNLRGILPSNGSDGQLADVLALEDKPTHLLILSGTNDIGNGSTIEVMKSTMISIWAKVIAKSITPVTLLDLPRAWQNSANRIQHHAWNTWLYMEGPKYGAVIIDATPYLQNTADANGDPIAAYFYDTPALHPNVLGGYQIARPLMAYFNTIAGTPGYHGFSRSDVYNANNAAGNLIPSGGINAANGGTVSGTNVSGNVAIGMQISLTSGAVTSANASLVARTDNGAGNWQQIDIVTAANSTLWFYPQSDISVANNQIAVGDKIEFGFDVDASNLSNVSNIAGRIIAYNGANALSTFWPMICVNGANNQYGFTPNTFTGRVEFTGSDAMTLPATTTRIVPVISITTIGASTGTVKVGAISVRKKLS